MSPELAVYIDEAGDPGIRDGLRYLGDRLEWLCLSAIVIDRAAEPNLVGWVKEMRQAANARQGGSLHYHRITAARREPVCAVLAGKPVRAFVLASHKSNLREYVNPRVLRMIETGKFYNWCLRLLLERVTAWCEWRHGRLGTPIAPLQVTFARCGGHNYEELFSYFDLLRMQVENGTLYRKGPGLAATLLDRADWSVANAEDEAGLQIADTVASAFYQAANTASPTRDLAPARALKPIIAGTKGGRAPNNGLTVWPLPDQAELPADARAIFEDFGYAF